MPNRARGLSAQKPTVSFVSLGCPKALVDTETMMGSLAERAYPISFDPESANVVIINTCSFIEPARSESFDVIREFVEKKKAGGIAGLLVVGCLPQLMGHELAEMFPEVDRFLQLSEMTQIADVLEGLAGAAREPLDVPPRLLATPPHTAYLKIAEGCDNRCSYCLIPTIRGPLISRAASAILLEAEQLADLGVKELNVIAQDVAGWGREQSPRPSLPRLLEDLCRVDGIEWIRLLYMHPASITDQLIETIAAQEKLCNYLDLPIQHSEDGILSRMNRRTTRKRLEGLVSMIRCTIPDVTLRTTVMVGFPGETDEDFDRLLEFVEVTGFDRLGAFVYCLERGAPASSFPNQVPEKVKRQRFDKLMRLQADISHQRNQRLVGRRLDVIVDQVLPRERGRRGPTLVGRTGGQAPDIDGNVFVQGAAEAGEIVRVEVTGADDYDLHGVLLDG